MTEQTMCPKCKSENIYQDGNIWICPECNNEWAPTHLVAVEREEVEDGIRDASGNLLKDGDTITVIKELKIKGSSSVVKVGTKVKNIRLFDGEDGHNIGCKIEGMGSINLKSEFVRKV